MPTFFIFFGVIVLANFILRHQILVSQLLYERHNLASELFRVLTSRGLFRFAL